ncbi:MAG: phosphoribosylanthranilate isomerase [Lachnospiraceae bacterium]
MTKIKLCGLTREEEIRTANELMPEYIGFVFAPNSRRRISPAKAMELRKQLHPAIRTVGVFVQEEVEAVAALLHRGVIDIAQLHGSEDEEYIRKLRTLSEQPIIKAFRCESERDMIAAQGCPADYVLLDSGTGGSGEVFDWTLLETMQRPYFLAGGLTDLNVSVPVERYHPYAVDVSSGIESNGVKDIEKMKAFVCAVRKADRKG